MTPTSFSRPLSEPLQRLPISSELTFQASLTQKSSNFGPWTSPSSLQDIAILLNNRVQQARNALFSNSVFQNKPFISNLSPLITPFSSNPFKNLGVSPLTTPVIPNSFSLKSPLYNPFSQQNRALFLNSQLNNPTIQAEQPLTIPDQVHETLDYSLPTKIRAETKFIPENSIPAQKKIRAKIQEKTREKEGSEVSCPSKEDHEAEFQVESVKPHTPRDEDVEPYKPSRHFSYLDKGAAAERRNLPKRNTVQTVPEKKVPIGDSAAFEELYEKIQNMVGFKEVDREKFQMVYTKNGMDQRAVLIKVKRNITYYKKLLKIEQAQITE